MPSRENNYAFIDSQNVNLSIKSQGWALDFVKFRHYLHDKYKITQAFIFIGYIQRNQKLYTFLQQAGYILVFKPVLVGEEGKPKGNVDAELVLHTMIQYPNYDRALIITGDGDFYCLVEHLIENNKLQNLMIPNREHYSALYRKRMQHIVFMHNFRHKVEKK